MRSHSLHHSGRFQLIGSIVAQHESRCKCLTEGCTWRRSRRICGPGLQRSGQRLDVHDALSTTRQCPRCGDQRVDMCDQRLVQHVWQQQGQDAYHAIWLSDADMILEESFLQEFFTRWCSLFPTGPPIIAHPTIRDVRHGQSLHPKQWTFDADMWDTNENMCRRRNHDCWLARHALALRVAFVSQQAALFDATFLRWFWET